MALYDYENNLANLTNKYQNDTATNQYARFISQQRFARQDQDTSQSFARNFPHLTAGYAARGFNGAHVQSGIATQGIGDYVGDYNNAMGRSNEDAAAYESNWQNQNSQMGSQYQQALLALQEELQRQRAMALDPYANSAPPVLGGGGGASSSGGQ